MKIISNGRSLELGSGGGSASEDYSTEEQVIGTWIDGKPIYRQIIFLQTINLSVGTWNSLFTIQNFDQLVKCQIISHNKSQYNALPSSTMDIKVTDGGVLAIAIGDSWFSSIEELYCFVEYTKTTDDIVKTVSANLYSTLGITAVTASI